ncbi:MAG: hypothetical protein J6W42_10025 [Bacteroidaceae bacterium]|nr:hypothetical protein [Bacteroidaceae bacterium]
MRTGKNLMKSFVVFLPALLFFHTADAGSWRVNSDVSKKPHFIDLNAAMNSSDVISGDTIYLDPGCNLTSTQDITKQVTIIGTGYLISNNVIEEAVVSGPIYLKASGIKIEGLKISGTTYMASNDITIERSHLKNVRNSGTAQNVTIRQCYIPNGDIRGEGNNSKTTANWRIENSIIIFNDGYDPIKYLYSPTVCNNYIRPNYTSASASIAYVDGANIYNNIFINTRFIENANLYEVTNSKVQNNIFHIESYKTDYPDNTIIDINTEEAVFAIDGINELRYRLKENSPAKGAATDGGDCGPYGGTYPYVPSGYPLGIPRFESSSVSSRPQDGLLRVSQKVVIQAE